MTSEYTQYLKTLYAETLTPLTAFKKRLEKHITLHRECILCYLASDEAVFNEITSFLKGEGIVFELTEANLSVKYYIVINMEQFR